MTKNLDGIRKLSGEELKRSRKMVLDYIGEEDKSEMPENETIKTKNIPKTMDGIMVSKKKITPALPKEETKKKFNNKDFFETLSAQEEGVKNELKEEVDNSLTIAKAEEEKKKLEIEKEEARIKKEEEAAVRIADEQERIKIEAMSAKKQKLKEEEELKKEMAKKEEVKKEKEKLANEKKEENKRKKSSLETIKKKRKNRKKKKRKELKNRITRKHKDLISYFKDGFKKLTFKKVSKFLLYLAFFATTLMLFLYILFSFILLRVNHDSEAIKKVAVYVPVPAIVFNKGIVSYKRYNELFKNKNNILISETLILEKLAMRYNLALSDNERELNREMLEEKVIKDEEINKVSFILLRDLKEAIEGGMKFSDAKEKYGNDKIKTDQETLEKLKDDVKDLKINEISSTIITKNGNYIVKKSSNSFDYIRVDNINLDEYLANEISKLKYWILVK